MTIDPVWWWVLAIALIVIGFIGTFLPAIPGAPAVFGGMLLAAWIDDFQRVTWVALTILGVLTALTLVVDIVGSFVGAKRVGASRLALGGAAIGALVGLFFGLIGIIVGPFIGAAAGELMARRRLGAAARVGIGTWLGLMVGALAKIALVLAMIVVFLTSYFL